MLTPARTSGTSGYPIQLNGRVNKTLNSFKVITNSDFTEGFDWEIKDY